MPKAVQLIRANRYNYRGKVYHNGKTEVVSDEIADYLLNKRNPNGARYFGVVKIHTVLKKEPVIPDEEIIDLDDVPTEPEVLEETVEVTAEELAALEADEDVDDSGEEGTGEIVEV